MPDWSCNHNDRCLCWCQECWQGFPGGVGSGKSWFAMTGRHMCHSCMKRYTMTMPNVNPFFQYICLSETRVTMGLMIMPGASVMLTATLNDEWHTSVKSKGCSFFMVLSASPRQPITEVEVRSLPHVTLTDGSIPYEPLARLHSMQHQHAKETNKIDW